VQITTTLVLDDREIDERFVRASGPGGQNVNKVATAVELRLDLRSSSLPEPVKQRLAVLAGRKLTADGVLLIDSREHRTQAQNREAARDRLAALLRQAAAVPKTRRPTKVTRGAKQRRLSTKKQRAEVKAGRRRPSGAD
jgi:ribosome-associated protein